MTVSSRSDRLSMPSGSISSLVDVGPFRSSIARVDPSVAGCMSAIQGLLIHADNLHRYPVGPQVAARASRSTRTALDRLQSLSDAGVTEFGEVLPYSERQTGTCRDYAVMLTAFLRAHGHTARVRCGFANYFRCGRWEDHWVTEYRDRNGAWRLADAQLDEIHREQLQIDFDPSDVPRTCFMTGLELALFIRSGAIDPTLCGHGDAIGLWFVHVNVARNLLTLTGWITSDWDSWRDIPLEERSEARAEQRLRNLLNDASLVSPSLAPEKLSPYWLNMGNERNQ